MPRSSIVSTCKVLTVALLLCASVSPAAGAQGRRGGQTDRRPPTAPREPSTVLAPQAARPPAPAARESEVACGGAISTASVAPAPEIIGAEEERERRVFAQGDMVYISAGAQQGAASVGQEFSVVRPRGRFRSQLSRKKGALGVYVQEVGRVRVVRVRDRVSVAEVIKSCDNLLLGDMLRPAPRREVPVARGEVHLDRFAEPTGKQTGRIVLARDGREMVSRDQVVFIDLGAEDNLKVGDYLTVFRPLSFGTLVGFGEEMAQNTRRGFESDEFRGGKFSNQAQRLKNPDGGTGGETVKTPEIKRRRPAVPRQVVGELVVIHVEGRAATAVITRVAREVHTGDYVEVQ